MTTDTMPTHATESAASVAPVERRVMALVADADVTVKKRWLDPLTLRVTLGRIHPSTNQPESNMTNAQYVIRAAQLKGLSLIKPTKGNPGILAIDYNNKKNGVHPCVIDAQTWAQAREQLSNYYRA